MEQCQNSEYLIKMTEAVNNARIALSESQTEVRLKNILPIRAM
jgi:hypothetical protein